MDSMPAGLAKQLTNIASCLIGAAVFVCLYGFELIDPTNTAWCLYEGADAGQSYLAWKSYRVSEWFFPWGMQNNLAYPSETSCMFTFCAPLFSFVFKLLSPILPTEFQFIGLFGLVSFMLQALFACWIIKLYSDSKLVQLAAPPLFLFVPVFIDRWMEHSFIGAHWLLLLSIFVLFNYREYIKRGYRIYVIWFALGALSAGIQMYWCMLCGFILMGYCIADALACKTAKRGAGCVFSFLVSAVFVTWILGGFSSLPEVEGSGLGVYSMNLNALINPQGWSSFFLRRPVGDGQYEGLAYLGCGFILLLFVAVVLLIRSGRAKEILINNRPLLVAIVCCWVLSFLFALSPIVTFDDQVLFELPLPKSVEKAWGVFRATGRFAWIVVYLIMVCSSIVVVKLADKRIALVVLLICLCLQICDLNPGLSAKRERYAGPVEQTNPYSENDVLNEMLAARNPEHLVYVGGFSWTQMRILDDWALSNHLTLNSFYFARSYDPIIQENTLDALEEPTDKEVFVFNETNIQRCMECDLNYYLVNGLIMGITYDLPQLTSFTNAEIIAMYSAGELELMGTE